MNVVVDGLMTNYQKTGQGDKLVFLHGWGDSSQTFSKLTEQLRGKYEILSLDLPGFGGTQAPPEAWDAGNYARFLKAWLAKLGIKDIYGLVGHSYGGTIAIAAAGDHIIETKKLILLASSGIRDIYRIRRLTLRAGAKVVKVPLKVLPAATQQRIKRKAYGAIGSDALLLPHMQLTFKKLIGQDMQETAARITVPTLLIYGAKDKETPLKYGQLFQAAIKGSRLEILDGTGHFLQQEEPLKLAGMISDFLEGKP